MKPLPRFFLPTTIALLLTVGSLLSARLATRYQSQLQAQPAATARWEQHVRKSREERDALFRRLDAARQQPAISPTSAEPVSDSLDLAQATEVDRWVRKVQKLKQSFAGRPDQKIPELALLNDGDWLRRARLMKLETEDDLQRAFAIMRNDAKNRLMPWMQNAMNRYVKEHHGQLPSDPSELSRYFGPTFDPAILEQYEMVRSGPLSDAPTGPILKTKSIIDDDYDNRINISRDEDSSLTYGSSHKYDPAASPTESRQLEKEFKNDAESAIRTFVKANQGALPTNPTQLVPYFNPPLGPLMAAKFNQPMSAEDQKKFQNDAAKVVAGHHLP